MSLMLSHKALTALNVVLTMQGADAETRVATDWSTAERAPWRWEVLDKLTGSGWQVEFEGSEEECRLLDHVYHNPEPAPF